MCGTAFHPVFFIGALASYGNAGHQLSLYVTVKRVLTGGTWPASATQS